MKLNQHYTIKERLYIADSSIKMSREFAALLKDYTRLDYRINVLAHEVRYEVPGQQIAQELGIHPRTVYQHLDRHAFSPNPPLRQAA